MLAIKTHPVSVRGCRQLPCSPLLPVARLVRPGAQVLRPEAVKVQTNPQTTTKPEAASPLVSFLKQAAKGAALSALAVALVLGRCDAAHAARSAGRVGGFSGPSASRSYGGGGGGFSGGRSSYGGGYSGGITSFSSPSLGYRPPIVVPGPPIIVPSPYYSSGLMAAPAVVSTGPGLVDVAVISIFLVMAASAARSALSGDGGLDGGMAGGGRPTLTRVQVGLLSLARELKDDLDDIASRANTSDSRGLHQLLQEVALALLRNPKYCVYGDVSQQATASAGALESAFNRASLQERSKFEAETLVNVGGRRRSSGYSSSRPGSSSSKPDELIVVTMLVATGCKVDLPAKISSLSELQQALRALGAVPADEVMGVELMWTPQAEGDYYTRDEIASDYPNLRNL